MRQALKEISLPRFHVFGSLLLQKVKKCLPSTPHSPPAQVHCIIMYNCITHKNDQEINRILVGNCNQFHLKGISPIGPIGVDTYSTLWLTLGMALLPNLWISSRAVATACCRRSHDAWSTSLGGRICSWKSREIPGERKDFPPWHVSLMFCLCFFLSECLSAPNQILTTKKQGQRIPLKPPIRHASNKTCK